MHNVIISKLYRRPPVFPPPPSPQVTLSPRLVGIIDRSFAESSWAGLQAHVRDPAVPFTLCHGDFHAANMFLRPYAGAPVESGACVRPRLLYLTCCALLCAVVWTLCRSA